MKLVGGKVVLREKRQEDALNDFNWRSDPELAKLDAAPPLRMSYEDFLRYYRDELRFPVSWSRRFAVLDRETGAHIGNCMYYDVDTVNRRAELGIMIGDKPHWGRSYGYDAMVTMIDYLFAHTSIEHLYLHTLEWNLRARKAFQKVGLKEEGPVRKNGYRFIYMTLQKTDWKAMREEKLALRDSHAPPEPAPQQVTDTPAGRTEQAG